MIAAASLQDEQSNLARATKAAKGSIEDFRLYERVIATQEY